MKTVFIADAHLKGLDDPNQKRLVRFLDGLQGVSTLVILGDLFDFWTGFGGVVYQHYVPVLDSLLKLREGGVRIIYLEGNHDFTMGRFFTETLGAGVYPVSAAVDIEGKKTYLAHGDHIAGGRGHAVWRRFLRSALFRLIARLAGPAFVWKVAVGLSKRSRSYGNGGATGGDGVDALLRSFAKGMFAKGYDAVILAHSHVPGVHRENAEGKTGIYANPGSWDSGASYLLFEEGEFKTKRYEG